MLLMTCRSGVLSWPFFIFRNRKCALMFPNDTEWNEATNTWHEHNTFWLHDRLVSNVVTAIRDVDEHIAEASVLWPLFALQLCVY